MDEKLKLSEMELSDDLKQFQKNMYKKNGFTSKLHNLYEIKLINEDGSVETKYGMNVMTNLFFQQAYLTQTDTQYTLNNSNYLIFIGNGADSTHIPNVENAAMFNNFATTVKSTQSEYLRGILPIEYDSTSGYIIGTTSMGRCTYDYNYSGKTTDVTINEIGYGPYWNKLVSHSLVYDINGNPSSITKRINQTLQITLYWRYSIHKDVIINNWNNGLYGGFCMDSLISPQLFSSQSSSNFDKTAYCYLGMSYAPMFVADICAPAYFNYSRYDSTLRQYINYGGTWFDNNNKTLLNDDKSITSRGYYTTLNIPLPKFVMEYNMTIQFFSTIVVCSNNEWNQNNSSSNWGNNGDNRYCASHAMFFFKRYQLPVDLERGIDDRETLEGYVKTDSLFGLTLADVTRWDATTGSQSSNANGIFVGRYYGGFANADYIWQSTLRGQLPCVDMDIQSIHRYNHTTKSWDIVEGFSNNAPNNISDVQWWKTTFYEYMKWPDNVTRKTFICSHPLYQTHKVKGVNITDSLVYASDTYWDTSTWIACPEPKEFPQEAWNKKYYIFSREFGPKTYSYGWGNGGVWADPIIEYPDPIPQINPDITEADITNIDEPPVLQACEYPYVNEDLGMIIHSCVYCYFIENNETIDPCYYAYDKMIHPGNPPTGYSNLQYYGSGTQFMVGQYMVINGFYQIYNGTTRNYEFYDKFFIFNMGKNTSTTKSEILDDMTTVEIQTTSTGSQGIGQCAVVVDDKYYVFTDQYDTKPHIITPSTLAVSVIDVTLYSYTSYRPIHGTSKLLIQTTASHFVIYDLDNNVINVEFDLLYGHTVYDDRFCGVGDLMYIMTNYEGTMGLQVYSISTGQISQISNLPKFGSTSGRFSMGFKNDGIMAIGTTSFNRVDIATRGFSQRTNSGVVYHDGKLYALYDGYSNGFVQNFYLAIIDSQDPTKLIVTHTCAPVYTSGSINHGGLNIIEDWGSIYLFNHVMFYNTDHLGTQVLDVGRLLDEGSFPTANNTPDCAIYHDGVHGSIGEDRKNNYVVPYKHAVIHITTDNVMHKRSIVRFITHKLVVKTRTVTSYNNPKEITLPQFSITVTNQPQT